MNKNSKFIIVRHDAKKAGVHFDLRWKKLKGKLWDSFACRKEIPLKPGKKILATKTHDHSEKDALTTKPIKSGYGEGTYKKIDGGNCVILRYSPSHIVIELKGSKYKGVYHLINFGVMKGKKYKSQQYLLFKGKLK